MEFEADTRAMYNMLQTVCGEVAASVGTLAGQVNAGKLLLVAAVVVLLLLCVVAVRLALVAARTACWCALSSVFLAIAVAVVAAIVAGNGEQAQLQAAWNSWFK